MVSSTLPACSIEQSCKPISISHFQQENTSFEDEKNEDKSTENNKKKYVAICGCPVNDKHGPRLFIVGA